MNVIGKTDGGFLIDVSQSEMANLVGYYSNYSDGFKTPKIGDKVCIDKMFNQLYKQSSHSSELENAAKKLREIADQLALVNPILERSQS